MNKIEKLISDKGCLIADGATGTNLFSMGLDSGHPPELWNIEFPERVYANHQNFIDAGSDLILTNSFGANRFRLALHKAENRVHELNFAAASIARKAADGSQRTILVAGSAIFDQEGDCAQAVESFRIELADLSGNNS